MNIILYIAIFSIGVVFGSFFTLAVYRIPRKEDITHVRSHCTTCGHRLEFIDLIPVLSYLLLGGKCRYCKERIRPRYFILEIFSGFVFLALAYTRGINFESSIMDFVKISFIYLFVAGTFIIAGIDKERYEIPNGLIIYELVIGVVYNVFLYAIGESIIFNIFGFLALPILLLIINYIIKLILKDENKLPFGMGDIKYIAVLGLFIGFGAQMLTICLALLVISIVFLFKCGIMRNKIDIIPFAFYLSIAVNVVLIALPYLQEIINSINFICVVMR